MSKHTLVAWRWLGIGTAASALTLAIFAIAAIAVVSAPSPPAEPSGDLANYHFEPYDLSEFKRIDATLTISPTPVPTPEPTPAPTPGPTPEPVVAAPQAEPQRQPAAVPAPTQPPAPPPPPPPPTHGYRNDIAQTLLTLLNSERANNGAAGVSSEGALTAAAEYYAKLHFTTANPYQLNHYLDGGPGNRAWARGYCCAVGEILVTSEGSPEGMVQLWMNSPSHRAVIVDPQYNDIGVSCYGGEYTSPDGAKSNPLLCSADFGAGGG